MPPHGAQSPETAHSGLPEVVILEPCKRQPPPRWCGWKSTIQHRSGLEIAPRLPSDGASTIQTRPKLEAPVGGAAIERGVTHRRIVNLTQLACVWIRHAEERDDVEEVQTRNRMLNTTQLARLNRISACDGLQYNLVENVRAALEHRDKSHNQATLRRVGNCDVESEHGWTAQFCKARAMGAPFASEPASLTWDAATRSMKRLLPCITVSYSYYVPPGDVRPGGVGWQCRTNLQRFIRVGLPRHSSLAPNVVLNVIGDGNEPDLGGRDWIVVRRRSWVPADVFVHGLTVQETLSAPGNIPACIPRPHTPSPDARAHPTRVSARTRW